MPGVYLQGDGGYVKMTETKFGKEDELQALLEHHVELLAGDEMNEASPRRFALVRREAGVPDEVGAADRWSIDHLFIDQDSVPTLVECKRKDNPELRRKVVAQMFDYAANMPVYWDAGRLRAEFEGTCERAAVEPTARLAELLDTPDPDADSFWAQAETNLRAGRLRLLFVADGIPPELRRIIEFLNEQMRETEVLGVDVGRYVAASGESGPQVIVSSIVGNTQKASDAKGSSSGTKTNYEDAKADAGPEFAQAEELFDEWATSSDLTAKTGPKSRGYLIPDKSAAVVRLYPASGEPRAVLDLVGMDSVRSEPLLEAIRQRGGTVSDAGAYPSISIERVIDQWDDLVSSVLDPLVEAWKAQLAGPQ